MGAGAVSLEDLSLSGGASATSSSPCATLPRQQIASEHQRRRLLLHASRHLRIERKRAPGARRPAGPGAGRHDLGLSWRRRRICRVSQITFSNEPPCTGNHIDMSWLEIRNILAQCLPRVCWSDRTKVA